MATQTKSLKANGSNLADAKHQIALLNKDKTPDFNDYLKRAKEFPLKPSTLEIMQINVGKMCNQVCEHCHVDAGPDRKEIMTKEIMQECLTALDSCPSITTIDLTGGAPEMNPNFKWLVTELAKRGKEIIVRSNLTILLANKKYQDYPQFFTDNKVHLIASLPCYTEENTDKQRGDGVFAKSLKAITILNKLGYGKEGTGLVLDFAFNPGGPYLPGKQADLEADYKRILGNKYNIVFNSLYTITNMPISRFLDYLIVIGKDRQYMELLVNAFNPNTVKSVMCKNTISISWDGLLYDCDFNQMLDLPVASSGKSIAEFNADDLAKRNIIVNQHCYGCTAGAGSSCQGAFV
ncbi:MAG: radical SAM/Cys-rich protein [Saprospiraceae bacterium]|jgi:radical SAM/Cys-rich protein